MVKVTNSHSFGVILKLSPLISSSHSAQPVLKPGRERETEREKEKEREREREEGRERDMQQP